MCADIVNTKTMDSLPLSRHQIVTTTRVEEATDILSRSLIPLSIARVAEPRRVILTPGQACGSVVTAPQSAWSDFGRSGLWVRMGFRL